jgi:hypothetical protein
LPENDKKEKIAAHPRMTERRGYPRLRMTRKGFAHLRVIENKFLIFKIKYYE